VRKTKMKMMCGWAHPNRQPVMLRLLASRCLMAAFERPRAGTDPSECRSNKPVLFKYVNSLLKESKCDMNYQLLRQFDLDSCADAVDTILALATRTIQSSRYGPFGRRLDMPSVRAMPAQLETACMARSDTTDLQARVESTPHPGPRKYRVGISRRLEVRECEAARSSAAASPAATRPIG
jgi:hypothetical protein